MVLLGLKTYLKEAKKLKDKYPQYFSIRQLIKFFPAWRSSLSENSSPLQDGKPWITFLAFEFLQKRLTKEMRVYEYGVGGSTIFLAKKVKEVISAEHDPAWFNHVSQVIKTQGYKNWCGHLIEPTDNQLDYAQDPSDPNGYISADENFVGKTFKDYASSIDQYPDNYFDVILIDGRARPSCFKHAVPKVKNRGIIVLDNTDRDYYLTHIQPLIQNTIFLDFPGFSPHIAYLSRTSAWQFQK